MTTHPNLVPLTALSLNSPVTGRRRYTCRAALLTFLCISRVFVWERYYLRIVGLTLTDYMLGVACRWMYAYTQ